MIDKLPKPTTVNTPDGLPVHVTHRAWGFTHQLWNRPEVVSYSVLGVVDPVRGFRPVPGTEEMAEITGDDYAQLIAPRGKKKRDVFRKDDVIALHKAIVARKAAEAAKAAAKAPARK